MKTAKRALAVMLALVLTVLSASAAFAAAPEPFVPTIYIHGFMGVPLQADRNDPDSEEIWFPDMDAIFADVKKVLPDVLREVVCKDWDALGDTALGLVDPYFTPTFYGDDATPINETGVWFEYPTVIPRAGEVRFRYDWREDPFITAANLNDFINYVCALAGVDQVNIHAHSYGGIVLTTYLTLYGNEKIRAAVLDATAIYGEDYTGDLMTGKMALDVNGLENYLIYALAGSEYETLLTDLLKTARHIGLTKLLVKLGDEIVASQKERVERELMLPMFANWLPIWCMIPDEDVDAAMHFVFEDLCAGQDRSALREKVEAYNTRIRPYKTETLKALNERANVYVLSRTGYSSIPVTPSQGNLSDGTVDTKYSSFGATVAPYGKTLPDDVLKNADPAFVSPEKDIDASTCLFPAQTWFLRGAKHSASYQDMLVMMATLLASPTQATVDTYPQYPRFLKCFPATGTLQPDTGETPSFAEHLRAVFAELKALIASLVGKSGIS